MRLHEFVDIGVPGTVSTRRAACHMCANCWAGKRRDCENIDYTGEPTELTISREQEPETSLSRVTRSQLNQSGLERADNATVGSNVCVETHNAEQTVPWVLGRVVAGAHVNEVASPDFDESHDTIRFEPVRAGDRALRVRLWEALEPGSSTFTLSNIEVLVAARRVRVLDVELVEARQSARGAEHGTRRFVIAPADPCGDADVGRRVGGGEGAAVPHILPQGAVAHQVEGLRRGPQHVGAARSPERGCPG